MIQYGQCGRFKSIRNVCERAHTVRATHNEERDKRDKAYEMDEWVGEWVGVGKREEGKLRRKKEKENSC